ncbi:MAG TPA: rhomboid family intramembrane serine protease [Pyrinomonadaceae bacterium]|nr:rhomboid family intramembrane serine protease [Pyrinomonadaceae bacterium]
MDDLQQSHEPVIDESPAPAPPAPIYTYILIGSIAAVFIAQMIFGDSGNIRALISLVGDDRSALAAGFVKPYVVRCHEYWRILTGAAVHGGAIHVVMNCYAFLMFGRLCEVLSNRAHTAIVFLLACIGGGLLSFLFLPDTISVGASGGIVGLLGYITVYAFRRRRFISPEFRKGLLINIGSLFIFGLVLFNVVDNYGHLGGLVVGALYGLIQIPSNEYVDPRRSGTVTKILGIAAVAVFVVTCLAGILLIANYRKTVLPETLDGPCTSSPAR